MEIFFVEIDWEKQHSQAISTDQGARDQTIGRREHKDLEAQVCHVTLQKLHKGRKPAPTSRKVPFLGAD